MADSSELVGSTEGVVLSRAGGVYRVYAHDSVCEAALRGRLKQGPRKVLVGDRVRLAVHPDGTRTIERIEPRRSILQRRNPGKSRGVRAVAANVDQVIVVGATRAPDWNQRLMDRFVAVAEANDLPVMIVCNKSDLCDDADDIVQPYTLAGYATIVTSTKNGGGIARLRECLEEHISLFTGPTGVGKSSLLNAIEPGLSLRTGAVSSRSRAGRHTTVAAEMIPLGRHGFVVDTPGLRDVGLWGLESAEVAAAFPEFATVGRCRFDNCRHSQEPGCAVVAAVEGGSVHPARLASYRAFLAEAAEAARPWAGRKTT